MKMNCNVAKRQPDAPAAATNPTANLAGSQVGIGVYTMRKYCTSRIETRHNGLKTRISVGKMYVLEL
jgi:hypothetical protein